MGIFRNSRLRLTLILSSMMCLFLILFIFGIHEIMERSVFSEQRRELTEEARGIAEAQAYQIQHPRSVIDENRYYRNTNDRFFYYIFEDDYMQLVDFVRASLRVESFIAELMKPEEIPGGATKLYRIPDENGFTIIMLTSQRIRIGDIRQTVYAGKNITALYSGLQKATAALVILSVLALIFSSIIGYIMAGRAILPMKEAYEKQKQFAADASHELRTPLAVVMASADLLLADKSIQNPILREVIQDLKDEVKKMSKLVSDLLAVARSDNNAVEFKIQRLDLGDLLEQNIRMMTPLAEKKNIQLIGFELRKVMIQGDEQKIKQLILILVDNAIKYTPAGGKIFVTIESSDEEKAIFSVQDSGVGISPEDQERIFDRFFRVDKARSRAMGGNGLGLSIANEILHLHDGKISVESELGKGTKFTVELKTNLGVG